MQRNRVHFSQSEDTNSVRRCDKGVCGLQIFDPRTDRLPGRLDRCSIFYYIT